MRKPYDHKTGNQYSDQSNDHCFLPARWRRSGANILDVPRGAATPVQKPLHRLTIIQESAVSLVDYSGGRGVCWKIRGRIGVWWIIWLSLGGDWRVPTSVGEYRSWLGLISVPEHKIQISVATVSNYWTGADVCCGYLVGLHVGSGYLDWDRCQLRKSMSLIGVLGFTCLVESFGGSMNPVYG